MTRKVAGMTAGGLRASTSPYCGALALVVALLAAALPVAAQQYPTRPVRIIVPFAPGGSDVAARMLAARLGERLGQSFVIDNRPGAAGVLGTDLGAKAAPDGYTLTFATASFAVTAVAYKSLPYDALRDFVPVASVGSVPFALVTHPALPVRNVKQFVALAKARPGQLNYGSPGAGGIGHLAHVLFAQRAGIKVTHVPYKGTGPAVTALLSGELQFMMPNLIGALPLVQANRLRALGVSARKRSVLAPEVPTLAEAGVDGVVMGTWYGLLAPRGTPPAVVQLLNREISALLKTPDLHQQLSTRGVDPEPMSAEEFWQFVRAEMERWGKVIRDGNITPED